jgi:hypothetical protein
MRKMHRRHSAVMVLFAASMVAATPALAATAAVSADVKLHRFAAGTVQTACPSGQHVTVGGVLGQYEVGGRYIIPTGMVRVGASGLMARGFNYSREKEGHLKVIARCAKGAAPATVTGDTVRFSGEGNEALVACPAGTVVVGSGIDMQTGPRHIGIIDQMQRDGPTRMRYYTHTVSTDSQTMTPYASCAHGTAPTDVTVRKDLAGQKGVTLRATCPAPKKLLFGGFNVTGNDLWFKEHGAHVEVFGWNAASPTEWDVTAFNVGRRGARLAVSAYCR